MGANKALVEFRGRPLIAQLIERLAPVFAHAFIVSNEPARLRHLGLPVVTDAYPESGSVVGIYTSLLASPTDYVLCLACDMPFVDPLLLRCLGEAAQGYDAAVPRHGEYLEPLAAVYRRSAVGQVEAFLEEGGRRIDQLYERLQVNYLDVGRGRYGDPAVLFTNLNTPEDLARAEHLSAGTSERGEPLPKESVDGHRRIEDLAPRVRDFVARAPVPIVSFVGKKKSAKTGVLLGVITELSSRGHRVGVVKHDRHGFEVDVPGTDSYRLREAGAVVTGISSAEKYVWIHDVAAERSLLEIAGRIGETVDILITEGFKEEAAPKIEVSRKARSSELVSSADELLAIVSDQDFPGYAVPRFGLDDHLLVAQLVEDRILRACNTKGGVSE